MNISPEILNELKAISPLLAGLEKTNVFRVPEGYFNELHVRIADFSILNNTSAVDNINKRNLQQVPTGYFDTLSDSILSRVKAAYAESAGEELQNLSPLLSGLKTNVFSVPEGYFESFSASLVEKVKAQAVDFENVAEELHTVAPLLATLKTNVFSVPDGYFVSLPGIVVKKIKGEQEVVEVESAGQELQGISSLLSGLKKNIFSVPEGYFESFAGSVLEKINNEQGVGIESAEKELYGISPMLAGLKKNVFSVPEGYFASLAGNVIEKVRPQPAKVITMKKRMSWLKYAAAAVVTGAIAVSSLQIFNNYNNGNGNAVVTESGFARDVQASYQYKTEDDLNAGIAKLTDDDIIKYLEKNGNIMDNELLTKDIDVSEMPSPSDYLTDENTLNSYLDKLDAETSNKSKP